MKYRVAVQPARLSRERVETALPSEIQGVSGSRRRQVIRGPVGRELLELAQFQPQVVWCRRAVVTRYQRWVDVIVVGCQGFEGRSPELTRSI